MFKTLIKFSEATSTTSIGTGSYGIVYKTIYNSESSIGEKKLACKVVNKDEEEVQQPATLREMSFLSALSRTKQHSNVLNILGMEFNNCQSLLIHMPLYEMSLRHFLMRKRKTFDYHWIIEGIIRGVYFLHSVGITHRDLKTENILINLGEKELVLCDFGLCRFSTEKKSTLKIVSPPYRPPEVLTNQNVGVVNMYQIDSWSLGCVLYEIFNRKFLFVPYKSDTRQLKKIEETIATDEWINKIENPENKKYCDVIKNCIKIDPSKRISISEIAYELDIKCDKYELTELNVPEKFKKYSLESWKNLKNKFYQFTDEKDISSSTKDLAIGYMQFYLHKFSLDKRYESLLYKCAYYVAVRLNETTYPSINTVFEKEYSMRDINDMEKYIIKACDGNMWLFEVEINE